jgi:large subunit ribosomal protein L11
MAKEIAAIVKLQIEACKANPAPPVGTALGPRGVNIMNFCKEFNERTKSLSGSVVPVVITIYKDKSFVFVTKMSPTAHMVKAAAGVTSGSKEPGRVIVGKVTMDQVREIANKKIKDMTSASIEAAIKEVIGSAYSIGIEVIND